MSVSNFYVNHDKGQYFHCGILGWSCGFSAIGLGPGARALAILLSDRGTWRGDRISVVAETNSEFDDIFLKGVDIGVEVELMLIDVDGLEWVERELEHSIIAFARMCGFAIHLRRSDVMKMLEKTYGAGKWQRKYEIHLKGNTDTWSQQIIEARSRGLKVLA